MPPLLVSAVKHALVDDDEIDVRGATFDNSIILSYFLANKGLIVFAESGQTQEVLQISKIPEFRIEVFKGIGS